MPSLPQLRKQIDRVDDRIVILLNRRLQLAEKVGRVKALNGEKIYNPKREHDLLQRLARQRKGPLKNGELRRVYERILSLSRAYQTRVAKKIRK
jgi:chorismate mutase/prephenate dehydratase